ncbi:MAG: DUF1998 domain-containing protein, partial [Bacteroidetes bacterium]|nr:DUF1998 domain-containing protein [Bacteroidota bacterium]
GINPNLANKAGRITMVSLVEALSLAATHTLQIDAGELTGNWSPIVSGGGSELYPYLYDLLPGGAGYTRQVKDNFEDVFRNTVKLVSDCDCESSCYNCLRHYGNNYIHQSLDRLLARDLLEYLRTGIPPILSDSIKEKSADFCEEVLKLKNISYIRDYQTSGHGYPFLVDRGNGNELIVDIHHPLTDTSQMNPPATDHAYCSIDSYTMLHDLPMMMRRIEEA